MAGRVALWCCVTPEREQKTLRIMASLAPGWGERAAIVKGAPPYDNAAFVVWGHLWLALDVIPPAIERHRPFWFIDNGYWRGAGGRENGFYRITYRGPAPQMMREPDRQRAAHMGQGDIAPWRKDGRHVLIALQGPNFGGPFGIDALDWVQRIADRVRQHTDRPIVVREKPHHLQKNARSLADDLKDCWAVVTHSSNVAVEAAVKGIPVFVDAISAAASIGHTDLAAIETPRYPDNRSEWWASLMMQQFSLVEMADGTAYRYLRLVREQVDG